MMSTSSAESNGRTSFSNLGLASWACLCSNFRRWECKYSILYRNTTVGETQLRTISTLQYYRCPYFGLELMSTMQPIDSNSEAQCHAMFFPINRGRICTPSKNKLNNDLLLRRHYPNKRPLRLPATLGCHLRNHRLHQGLEEPKISC